MGRVHGDTIMYENRKKKKKRKRTVITQEENDRLEVSFKQDSLPDRLAKMDLAKEMGKAESFINIWFQNRRARERKIQRTHSCSSLEKGSQSDIVVLETPLNLVTKKTEPSTPLIKTGPVVRSPLFGRIIRMAGAAEGGILGPDCPHLAQARTDAWKGIQLADARLFYHPVYGFDVEAS